MSGRDPLISHIKQNEFNKIKTAINEEMIEVFRFRNIQNEIHRNRIKNNTSMNLAIKIG